MVSEGGGQGLVTLACFQDLSQARHRWPGQADGFPSLFGTTVVLPGIGDVRTLEALSVLSGDHEIVVRSVRGPGTLRPTAHGPARARTDPDRRTARDPVAAPARPGRHHPRSSRARPGVRSPQPAGLVPARPGPRGRAVAEPAHPRPRPRGSAGRVDRAGPAHPGRIGSLTRRGPSPRRRRRTRDRGSRAAGAWRRAPRRKTRPHRPSSSGGRTPGADPSPGARPGPAPGAVARRRPHRPCGVPTRPPRQHPAPARRGRSPRSTTPGRRRAVGSRGLIPPRRPGAPRPDRPGPGVRRRRRPSRGRGPSGVHVSHPTGRAPPRRRRLGAPRPGRPAAPDRPPTPGR